MNIKQLLALLAALLLIYSLPVQAMAADAGTQDAGAESAGMDEDTGTEPDAATGARLLRAGGKPVHGAAAGAAQVPGGERQAL